MKKKEKGNKKKRKRNQRKIPITDATQNITNPTVKFNLNFRKSVKNL